MANSDGGGLLTVLHECNICGRFGGFDENVTVRLCELFDDLLAPDTSTNVVLEFEVRVKAWKWRI